MKYVLFTFIAFCSISICNIAQTAKANPDHTNFYKPASADLNTVKIDLVDVVSQIEYSKFKLK